MSEIILNVIIILGIIIAGGFLIFFVSDLLLSIIDPKSDEKKIKEKRKKVVKEFNENIKDLPEGEREEILRDPDVAQIMGSLKEDTAEKSLDKPVTETTEKKEEAKVEGFDFDLFGDDSEKTEEKKEEKIETNNEKNEETENRLSDARAALERRKMEILRRMNEFATDDEEEEDEDISIDAAAEKIKEESVVIGPVKEQETDEVEDDADEVINIISDDEELEEAPVEEDSEDVVEDEVVDIEEDEEAQDGIEEAKRALEEEKERYKNLIKELIDKEQAREQALSEKRVDNSALKQKYQKMLDAKLVELEENEKDLRACKKEYTPIYKVEKTLEKDEKKLRIKEAQVAKQKVMLYGVNNYSDIDPEKAKKLAEELDLLDGLKLSVEHCREVVEKNKDRLPILDKMHKILSDQNEKIKKEIQDLKNMIENLD